MTFWSAITFIRQVSRCPNPPHCIYSPYADTRENVWHLL